MTREKTCFNCTHCIENGFDYDYAGGNGFCGSGEFYCKLTNRGIADGYGNGNSTPCRRFSPKKPLHLPVRPTGAEVIEFEYEEVS